MRIRKSTAKQSIDVVEASYSLDGSDADWFGRVLEAASPNFELGRGFYGFTCRIRGTDFAMGPTYVERNLDPRFGALVEQLNREAPNAVIEVLARNASIAGGFSEVIGVDHPGTTHFLTTGLKYGLTDAFSIFAQDGEGYGIDVSAPLEGIVETSPRVRGV